MTENATDPCEDFDGGGSSYLGWFIVGNMLHGVGGAAIYTLAIPYMDENIKSKNTALYIGRNVTNCFLLIYHIYIGKKGDRNFK